MKRIIGIPRAPHTSPEGDGCELLQGHHVEGGGDAPLPSGLARAGQLLQRLLVPELDPDADAVVLEVVLVAALSQPDLSSKAHAGEVVGEVCIDSLNQVF